MYDVDLNHVIRLLEVSHCPHARNEYGSVTTAGFSVSQGIEGKGRVTHLTPNPDLMDPDRTSDDELAAIRQTMTLAYARTLSGEGWTVQHRRPKSRYPYLLVHR